MTKDTIARDSEAVRAALSHWLYRISGKEPEFAEPFPDLAATACVRPRSTPSTT